MARRQHGAPLKVLWAIKGLGPGGAERLLTVAAACHDPETVALSCAYVLDGKDHLVADLRSKGVRMHSLGVRRGLDPRWVFNLVRLLRRQRFDVVHSHSPTVAIVSRLLIRARLAGWRRAALVTTEHNAWTTFHPATRAGCVLTTWLDDASISVSEETRRSLKPTCVAKRSEVVVHGIDLNDVEASKVKRAETRALLGIGDGEIVVTTVANYRSQKNYPNLLQAASQVLADRRIAELDVTFAAVGQGPMASEIQGLLRQLGLGERFRLLGYRDDAIDVLAASDIFVLASDYEGLPVALMEAMGLGLPVVATAVGGVAEVVTAQAGTLVPPNDVNALAAGLIDMLLDPVRRQSASAAASILGQQFDGQRTTDRIEQIYRSVANSIRLE